MEAKENHPVAFLIWTVFLLMAFTVVLSAHLEGAVTAVHRDLTPTPSWAARLPLVLSGFDPALPPVPTDTPTGTPTYTPTPTATPTPTSPLTPDQYSYLVVNEYPHDPQAFTQGLVFDDGYLYEGTGRRGFSSLRRVALETGEVLQMLELSSQYFGEGIAIYDGNRIAQLTWLSGIGFIYDKATFELLGQFEYATEGWGLTYDGTWLIMSDGTSTLHYLDPETLEEVSTVDVVDADGPVELLNELEYIEGEIYANVWFTDRIAIIDPETGHVRAWVDLQGLLSPEEAAEANVLNGIAYDADGDRLFVTGKWWPSLFEIKLVPVADESLARATPSILPRRPDWMIEGRKD